MAAKNTQQSRYRMISIMTFVVLLLSFAYYYFVYVQSNEDAFNSKAFRIIERAGENVELRYKNYGEVKKNSSKSSTTSVGIEDKFLKDIHGGLIVENILPKGFFQKYIVFSDNHVYWANFTTPENIKISLDTLFKRDEGESNNLFRSTDRLEIEFNNKTQMLYFSPVSLTDSTIYIGGIVAKSYFTKQAFKLGTNTLIVVLMLLLLLVLSIPFLKFILLSENERLNTWDAIFSFVVMALGSGFIMLSLLTYFSQQGPSEKYKKKVLKEYALKIEDNVLSEINDILSQVDKNESLLWNEELILKSRAKECTKNEIDTLYDKTRYDTGFYQYSMGSYWLNSKGEQLVKWQPKITPRVDVRFRKYFSVPNGEKSILWSDPKVNQGEGFYIEAIRSITTGKSYAVVSKKSNLDSLSHVCFDDKKPAVVSMGSRFQSLTDLSLPSNISYLVIDEGGHVLFHKDSTKTLQENLFEETNFSKSLSEAVYGRTDTIFRCNYNEVHSRFYITPLGELPLFILLILDEDLEKMTDARTLSLTVLLYLLLFFLFVLQFCLFVIVDYRRKKKIRGYSLFFKWVWPVASKKKVFQLLSIYLLVAIGVFLGGRLYENVLLSLSFFSFLVTVNLFVLRRFKKPFSLESKPYYLKYYIYFFSMLLIGVLLFPFQEQLNVQQHWFFIFFIGLSTYIIYLSVNTKKVFEQLSLRSSFNIWVFLFVMTLGIIPLLGFYSTAYNFEKSVYQQHIQLSLAQKIVQNGELTVKNNYRDYDTLNEELIHHKMDYSDAEVPRGREHKLIKELRIQLGERKEQSAVLKYLSSDSSNMVKWKETDSLIQLTYTPGRTANDSVASLTLTAQKTKINPGDFIQLNRTKFYDYRFEMLIAFILLAILLYLVVTYWSSKLFLLGIIPNLKSNIAATLQESSFVYIVSPPHAGVRPYVENQLNAKFYVEDLRYAEVSKKNELKPKNDDEVALVFDSGSLDTHSFSHSVERINALKQLVLNDSKLKKLIIISQFTPKKVLNTVLEGEQLYEGNENEKTLSDLKKLSAQYLDILGGFDLAYFKLGKSKLVCSLQGDCFDSKKAISIKKLDVNSINERCYKNMFDKEDLVLNTQNSEQLYYHAIWNSLEKREHLLIYDLSQDGLVNYRNLYVVYNLMSRGILIHKNGRLKLFNKSFTNFVLTIIDKEQALEFENDAKRTGSWANLKLPLMIVIVAVIMFMFLSQQEVFNQLIGWFTAAIAVLPILTRFIVTFSGFSGKK